MNQIIEKQNWLRLLLVCAVFSVGCAADNPAAPDRPPAWLRSLIQQLETEPVANPPAYIARYEYKGEPVYYLPARCCDVWSTLYRADGTIACHPDGGFGGRGDGLCPTFMAERTKEQMVWRDLRGAT